jgi:hypothetical protein
MSLDKAGLYSLGALTRRPLTHAFPCHRSRQSVTPQKQAVPRPAEATSLPPPMFTNLLNIRPLTSISIRPAPKFSNADPVNLSTIT